MNEIRKKIVKEFSSQKIVKFTCFIDEDAIKKF
jgi:hypothetical protein